jgi:hypothetical protein
LPRIAKPYAKRYDEVVVSVDFHLVTGGKEG